MFSKIYNPKTKRLVKANGKSGRQVIVNYQRYLDNHQLMKGGKGKNKKTTKKNHIRIFHATWCGHCVHSMPIFSELVKNIYETFKFTLHDVDKTDKQGDKVHTKIMEKLNIGSFPTIVWDKLVPINENSPKDHYEMFIGDRTINDILGWAQVLK